METRGEGKVKDMCGVCGGDNSTCSGDQVTQVTLNKGMPRCNQFNYLTFFTLSWEVWAVGVEGEGGVTHISLKTQATKTQDSAETQTSTNCPRI